MAVSGLWEWVRGYVIIRVTGRMLEKFVNMSAARQIELYDVTTLGPGTIMARVSLDGYRRLRPILRASGCWATVDERIGAPFLIAGLARREFLFVGLVIFVATLYGMSSVLWSVEIIGAETDQEQLIWRILDEMNVKRWTWLSSVDCDAVRSEITRSVQGIAWIGVETQGTALVIRVAGKVMPEAPAAVADIVASEDSVIVRLIVLAGDPLVSEGQTVAAGQVLVSGRAPTRSDQAAVYARAIVEGRVWREGRAEVPLLVEQRVRTGRVAVHYRICYGCIDISLGRHGGFDAFDTAETVKRLHLRRDSEPCVELTRIERYELALTATQISRGEAYALARAAAEDSIMCKIPEDAKIMSVSERISDEASMPGAVEVVLIMETIENIARVCER